MLVITRKRGEAVCIGNDIDVVVLEIGRGKVKLGFSSPREVSIRREEICHDVAPRRQLEEVCTQ